MSETTRRVFLVDPDKFPRGAREDGERITLGFLSFEPEVYARLRESTIDGTRGYTNQDPDADVPALGERERRIEAYEARELIARAAGALRFTRYRAKVGEHIWQVDQFEGPHEGLWLASVEGESPTTGFERPGWLGAEVSNDARYGLAALARAGRRPER